MIQPLREAHRRSFYLLVAIVPLLFVVGIVQRVSPIPAAAAAPSADATIWPSGLVATKIEVTSSAALVKLELRQPLREPDPLLYFTSSRMVPGGDLHSGNFPADALLLGVARDGASYSLPPMRGRLVLYSLGHLKVIDQLPVEVAP